MVALRSDKVKRWIESRKWPVDVLIDDSRDVLRTYGVLDRAGSDTVDIVRPSLFLITPDGLVRYAFVAEMQHEFPGFEEITREIRSAADGR